MARRRMVSQELIIDEDFNSLSVTAQNLFVRMLVVSDDYGVVPADEYVLSKLINPPKKKSHSIQHDLHEISSHDLGSVVSYNGKRFFIFKPESFERHQSYILGKRRKSEYLRLSKEVLDSGKFQEILGNVRPYKQRVESNKQRVESKEKEDEDEKRPKTLDEVKALFAERAYVDPELEAERFWNHFESIGWLVGKARTPMKRWKAAAANWNLNVIKWRKEKHEREGQPPKRRHRYDPEKYKRLGGTSKTS